MDENLKILIKDDKVDKLCGNNIVGIVKTVTSMKSNFEFLKKSILVAVNKKRWVIL